MNARDLNVPQFEAPTGNYIKNIETGAIEPALNTGSNGKEFGGQTPNFGQVSDKYGKKIKPEDLPEFEAKKAQNISMLYNAIEAQKARDGQEKMYGSRGQKTIADIKKAGLNPYIMNQFAPGGFGTGGAASIYSNIAKNYAEAKTKSENKNINKKEATPFDWLSLVLPIMGAVIGSFANPALGAIGGALGGVGARGIRKHFKK